MTIRQRTKSDCAIVAIANATAKSYREVRQIIAEPIRGGLHSRDIEYVLRELGVEFSRVRIRRKNGGDSPEVFAARKPVGSYVITISCCSFFASYHAIACVNGHLIGDYNREWKVVEAWKIDNPKETE